MAYNDNQNESPLPTNGNEKRTASDFIPKFFRTEANKKFLQGTIDQLIQPGVAERINGYVGRKTAKSFKSTDNYIGDVTSDRENYQLEPATVIKDNLDNVTFYKDYNDYIGTLNYFQSNTENHSRLNNSEYYAWNPNIDWDKFTNFREYYWAPNGPLSVPVRGQSKEVISTYTVTVEDQGDNVAYVFNDGLTRNPTLKLYRGQTYRFEIDAPGHPMAIAITRSFTPGSSIITAGSAGLRDSGLYDATLFDANGISYDVGEFIVLPSSGSVTFEDDENVSTLYPDGIRKIGEEGEEVAVAYIEQGTIEFTIPTNAPDRLYYISKNNVDTSGVIRVYDIEENTFLNVEEDILGKKTYTSANGVALSNGMKVEFQGDVLPKKYEQDLWYVEGVGDKIVLINEKDLIIPASYSENKLIPFDSDKFDSLPFANASAYAAEKDYIIINRASQDKNPWSRYNKWFHRDVLVKSYEYNNLSVDIDENFRARRPIIEFEAGLKLFNYGAEAKTDIDLIDTFTKDVFSTIEGKLGYNIDGIDLAEGMRVLFASDTDSLVSGKIYKVRFVTINNNRQINLVETEDTNPLDLETIFVTQGKKFGGKTFHYHKNVWIEAQEKTTRNQPPLFDLCCPQGNEYADLDVFSSSTFKGTKIFSYKVGEGSNDVELGFPLSYKTIENSGDIVFEFNLLNDTFSVQDGEDLVSVKTDTAFLRKYKTITDFTYVNGWTNNPIQSKQYVIRQYIANIDLNNDFPIDVFDRAGDLNDLKVVVYVNNKLSVKNTDYEITRINQKAFVNFYTPLQENDSVVIKAFSKQTKNNNGYYELPINLERNPLNEDINEFTLGEVIDHVNSMIEEAPGFKGVYPGLGNLRDLGDTDKYGKRFVKHASPLNLSLYHITNKKYNLIKSVSYANKEYNKFKRVFLETAESLGFDGETKQHVDKVLEVINKDKIKSQPFYFSDMLSYGPNNRIEYKVLDSRITQYPLSTAFTLEKISAKCVNVYLNKKQLVNGKDYTFRSDGYVDISANQIENDIIEIYEYNTSDGSYIAPTPTKLGLYPKYEPELVIDDTYQTDQPTDDGPYKIYGEDSATNIRGWFYPLYTTKESATTADIDAGGTGTYHTHTFNGLNINLYMPGTGGTHGGTDNVEIDAYPIGVAFIKGHDGSYIRAYLDYRDELLLDFEKRIFNNIKVNYDTNIINVDKFIGGDWRDGEFTKQEVDRSLLSSFTKWLTLVDNDYTDNFFYDRLNPFTFNYSQALSPTSQPLPGFWRGIYKRAFDTDRPHSNPWEILGFKIKPKWWNEVYGPAPYTSDNLILWRDIQEGKIAEPGNIRYNADYARPGITSWIPVDSQGKLKHPQESGYVKQFVLRQSTGNFTFGDEAPVETAWRRSSDYPFAVLLSMIVNKPSKIIGEAFDVSRISTNLANQKVYSVTNKNITLDSIVFPNTYADNERVLTAGLVNYIYNLVASDILTVYNDYQNEVTSITNQLGFKLGSFSDTKKLNLILDSRSPQQQLEEGGIYIPQENYKIFFNTSSPLDVAVYSGVVVEKTASGYTIRGYNNENPFFNYLMPLSGSKAVPVTVGGISEDSSEWQGRKYYVKDTVVEYINDYYRVIKTHTSKETFSLENLVKLPELPTVGGKTALFKSNFETVAQSLAYGTTLRTSQEVVDFLLGYGKQLQKIGFDFNFVEEDGSVNNWDQIAREFLFWTTQGWAAGTVITLSPAANKFNFQKDYYVVDNINDEFYPYSILQANGEPLSSEFSSLLRNQNSFGIQTENTAEGLYSASLPLVQKEHVVLIDNKTVFNDIVFQPSTGYRQERIRISGYKAADWNGGLNIPGFIFDDATVVDWEKWKDYKIGNLIKYKQYYYVAVANVSGASKFDSSKWYRLSEKPESELLTNFDYRINQFNDFYSLDTQGFDSELQRMAKHLTGFQKRQYLSNIIPDDVSQYKFYQGFIQDKGTKNALTKLFGSLGSAGENTLEFYEEWALQVGRYGAVDNKKQVEFNLKEDKLLESPQAIELVNVIPNSNFDKHYRILPYEVYDKPVDYNHKPFPTKVVTEEYIKSGGFVREEDVTFVASSEDELPNGNVNLLGLGDYIWITESGVKPWNVFQHIHADAYALDLSEDNLVAQDGKVTYKITLDRWASPFIQEGDIIGIKNAEEYNLTGLYIVKSINLNSVTVYVPEDDLPDTFVNQKFTVSKLRSVKVNDISEANTLAQQKLYPNQRFWIENYSNNDWKVIENSPIYAKRQEIQNIESFEGILQNYSNSIAVTADNRNLFVSSDSELNGKVDYYRRTNESWDLKIDQTILPPDFIEVWTENTRYNTNDIVVYDLDSTRTYWKAKRNHISGTFFSDAEVAENWTQQTDDAILYYDPALSKFGQSIDVSEDGEYLVIGAPDASYVKTKFKGNFDTDTSYVKGDIVRYKESLWRANREILPKIEDQPFSTFDSYINLVDQADTDSTSLTLLVSGDPGLENNVTDHFLIRAPSDMYNGTAPGDGVTLYWNQRSFAYPTLDDYFPFDNRISELSVNFLSREHIIQEKIDNIFFIETFVTLPNIGDFIQTDTGTAEVYYVGTNRDSAVLYLKNRNGVFTVNGELFTAFGDFVGFYTEENTYATSEEVSGYWLFKTYNIGNDPEPQTTELFSGDEFTYSNNRAYYDVGRGLVYSDVRTAAQILDNEPINVYDNIQDTISEIGPYVLRKNQASFINHLSFTGDNNGLELSRPDSRFVIRISKTYSDIIYQRFLNNPSYQINIKFFDNSAYDITPTGITTDDITGTHTIQDMWDGFIDFDFTEFDFQGNVFEPEIGDVLVDVQYPRDGQGGLALTTTTTSAAEVVFYQRNFNSVRVYVKLRPDIASGSWEQLTNIGRYELRRLSNPGLRGNGDPDQIIGTVLNPNNDIAIGTSLIGKLLVIDSGRNFPTTFTWDNVTPIIDQEYYFFNEDIITGIDREPNYPSSLNKDFKQVYNIPAEKTGTTGYLNQGAVSIFRKDVTGSYQYQITLVSEYAGKDKHFGSKVEIKKQNNLYKLLISNKPSGDARNDPYEWRKNPGAIEIYNHGTTIDQNFLGSYQLNKAYSIGDVVKWRDNYYIALKDTTVNEDQIKNSIYWNNISWQRGKDINYRGTYDSTASYKLGDIVLYGSVFWTATTNITSSISVPSEENTSWSITDDRIDYLGYLPNLTSFKALLEETYDPIENIEQFASTFSLDDKGETLVVRSKQQLSDSTLETAIAIYKLKDNKYELSQIIKAPSSSYILSDHDNDAQTPDVYIDINKWADSVSINPQGNKIAVSVPLDDEQGFNKGSVWVYEYNYTNQKFGTVDGEITQPNIKLYSPNNEEVEGFGNSLAYGKDSLVVSSINGDVSIPTRFDTFEEALENSYVLDTTSETRTETTFDSKFTSFKNSKIDKGNIYIFENLQNNLLFSERLIYENAEIEFGRNLLIEDNHIYVGLPNQTSGNKRGAVLDYRKPKNKISYNEIRSSVVPVDVSKIEGAFLYNKRTNEIVSYIDYIDPLQGKIAGIAEQEITYKLPLDPATYNVGDLADKNVNPKTYWSKTYVGQVWWNVSTARFSYPYQGSTSFQKGEWNKLLAGSSIDVYEWVESDYLPSQWNQLADTDNGVALGISGRAIYGDNKYSARLSYDDISQTFTTKYYFWVQNKTTIPQIENRNLNIQTIANLIARPRQEGYRFISFLSEDKFVLNNFDSLVTSDDLVLNIRYSDGKNQDQNEHRQYQILSDKLATSKPNKDIERKWFDSLIGVDDNGRVVPDATIPVAKRYGVQNRPRQSMFVNRVEALKQAVERINFVLSKNIIVDEKNISELLRKEEIPTFITNRFDFEIDTFEELEFISTNKVTQAKIRPIIVNGKIIRLVIEDSGRGYKVPPSYQIEGDGTGASFKLTINNLGQVTNAEILTQGSGYTESTIINVRRVSVLIKSDNTAFNNWAIYAYDNTQRMWIRTAIQSYDVTKFWDYVDWYADGYNQFSNIDFSVDNSYQLAGVNDSIGDIVKINNVGSGGWLLLEKISNENTEDYTINYNTIGRQDGTIAFKDNLYNFIKNTIGYDNRSYDSTFYDNNPTKELRIILETIRDDIFVGDLEVEYNQLFLASLRYILSEQPRVDWMFKTSFISAKHKLGELEQDITFQYNNLEDFEEYVREVKPFSTNIREYVDNYEKIDNTRSSVTDFDLSPYYDTSLGRIDASITTIVDNNLVGEEDNTLVYPRKHWRDNLGYQIKEIKISNAGQDYTFVPTVKIVGGGGAGATAKAVLGYGKVTDIIVTNPGNGYTSKPDIIIEGSQGDNGVVAKATAILGNGKVRSPHIRVKFDRLSGEFTYETIAKQTLHTGTNFDTNFELPYPMDLNNTKVQVFVNGIEQLRSKYTYENFEDTSKSYTRERGRIIFANPPALGALIEIKYQLPLSMLGAEDRILHSYNPFVDMYGKDLTQLMKGIDYGGIEVRSYDFAGISGWDTRGWYTDQWDAFDNTFEDEIFTADQSTIAVQLSAPLENGVVYNVYRRLASNDEPNPNPFVRLDDPNFGTAEPVTNTSAIMQSITGDGVTDIVRLDELNVALLDGDTLIIRKTTSDGSILPDTNSYDTQLSGGDLAYNTATGINAEDIITDGDGFISEAAMAGPEELVPGQIFDTLDIKVYTRESGGQGKIFSQNYRLDTSVLTYELGITPGTTASVFVKLNNEILELDTDYTINWKDNTLTLNTNNANFVSNASLNIVCLAQATQNVLDFEEFTGDGSTTAFETNVKFQEGLSVYASVNGVKQTVEISESISQNTTVIFETSPEDNTLVYIAIFDNDTQVNYSQLKKDSFVGDDNTTDFTLSSGPFYSKPSQYNLIVKVGNNILSPGYNIQYTIPANSQREYLLEVFQQPSGSLLTEDIVVFLNGVRITVEALQWRFDISNSSVVLADDIGQPGDTLEIFVITDGEYTLSGPATVRLNNAPQDGTLVDIYQFSNHDILEIERLNYDVVSRVTLAADNVDYDTYQRLTVGEVQLRKPAIDAKYVWVIKNGTLLSGDIDYYITDDKTKVMLKDYPEQNDVLDIIHFSAETNVSKFAFRQFKDILNRTHFKRLDAATTALATDLNEYDLRIEVVDGTELSEPNKGQNLPGIIFVNGERIEYFVKEGNTLRQLRRGTLGTGIKTVHSAGTKVYDQNISKTIPYRDNTIVKNYIADGVTAEFTVDHPTGSINELEIFVAGTRMNKNYRKDYLPVHELDSPEGDYEIDPDVQFDITSQSIILKRVPVEGSRVTIIKKQGKIWNEGVKSLGESENSIGRFLRAGTSELPE